MRGGHLLLQLLVIRAVGTAARANFRAVPGAQQYQWASKYDIPLFSSPLIRAERIGPICTRGLCLTARALPVFFPPPRGLITVMPQSIDTSGAHRPDLHGRLVPHRAGFTGVLSPTARAYSYILILERIDQIRGTDPLLREMHRYEYHRKHHRDRNNYRHHRQIKS